MITKAGIGYFFLQKRDDSIDDRQPVEYIMTGNTAHQIQFGINLVKGIFNLTAFVNFFYQLLIGNFSAHGSAVQRVPKVLLVFFELGDIFKNDCKSLTSLIKNQGYEFES